METKDYKEIVKFLEEELMDLYRKAKQNPTPECVELLKCMLSGIAKAETITAMRESGYSERAYRYGDDLDGYRSEGGYSGRRRYYRMDDGQSERSGYRRDGGQSNDGGSYGESYGGNSYHTPDELTEYLKRKVRSEQDDRRRSAFEEIMKML